MIIGISGRMGSGKSTAIDVLKAYAFQRNRAVHLNKFAGPLYAIQDYIYRMIEPVYPKPEGFIKDRVLLQWLGTNWGRDTISKTLWIDLWRSQTIKFTERDLDLIVVSDDVRFDNEAETVKSLGGYVIRLERKDSEVYAEGGVGIQNHASEAGIRPDLIDYTIQNNGTLEEFQEAFRQLIAEIEAGQRVA